MPLSTLPTPTCKWVVGFVELYSKRRELHSFKKPMTNSLHVLDAIGQLQPVNTITISKETGILKGTVSKTVKKLEAKNLIIKVPLPNNKKEANFYLTHLGKEIFELHHSLHQQSAAFLYVSSGISKGGSISIILPFPST